VFAVGGIPVLRVQNFQDIETVVTLGHNDFGGDMMAVWQANVTLLHAKFGVLPSLPTAPHLSL